MIRKDTASTNLRNYCKFILCFALLFTGTIFNVKSGNSETLVDTIPLGPEAGSGFAPSQVVVNPATNLVYISNRNSVSVIDGKTNKVIDNFKIENIGDIDVNSTTNRIYMVTLNGVNVIDGETNEIIDTISTVFKPGRPIGVNSKTNTIYIINYLTGRLSVIDGDANTIVDTIPLKKDSFFVGISVNSLTNQIYVACEDDNALVIDGETNRVVDIIKVGGRLSKIGVNPSTNRIYAQSIGAGNKNSVIKVIDGETNRIVDKIHLEGFVTGFDIDPRSNKIYATVASQYKIGKISIIDGESNQVVDAVPLGMAPSGVAVNTITSSVYVANMQNDSFSVIDGESNAILDTVQIGEMLYGGIGVNYETNRVYVGSWSSKSIIVIDGNSNKVINAVKAPVSPIGIPVAVAVNSTTNLIYVAIANDNIVAVIDGSTNKVVKNIKNSRIAGINEIGVNPLTNRIYVSSFRGVSVIDGKTNSVIDFVRGVNQSMQIGVNPATNLIYVLKPTNNVNVIDGVTNRVVDNLSISNLSNIDGIAVNSITNRIYVGSFFATTATTNEIRFRLKAAGVQMKEAIYKELKAGLCVIDGATNEVMDCLASPASTVIGVNHTTDRIYAAGLSNISVIDGATNEVVASVEVENGRKDAIAINPLTNHIYITNPDTGNVTVIKDDLQ